MLPGRGRVRLGGRHEVGPHPLILEIVLHQVRKAPGQESVEDIFQRRAPGLLHQSAYGRGPGQVMGREHLHHGVPEGLPLRDCRGVAVGELSNLGCEIARSIDARPAEMGAV